MKSTLSIKINSAAPGTKKKRPDSNRTEEARARAISRRAMRATYAKNGGRF